MLLQERLDLTAMPRIYLLGLVSFVVTNRVSSFLPCSVQGSRTLHNFKPCTPRQSFARFGRTLDMTSQVTSTEYVSQYFDEFDFCLDR